MEIHDIWSFGSGYSSSLLFDRYSSHYYRINQIVKGGGEFSFYLKI